MRMVSNTEAELKKKKRFLKKKRKSVQQGNDAQHCRLYIYYIYIYIYIYMINAIKNNYMSCMKTKNIRTGKNNANI